MKNKKKYKFLKLKIFMGIVVLAISYIMIVSLIPISSDMNPVLVDLVSAAKQSKEEIILNVEFYFLVLTIISAIVIPSVLRLKKKS